MNDPQDSPEITRPETPHKQVAFWESRYESRSTTWDLGEGAPPFAKAVSSLKPGKMAVLGCGAGHDAALFADAGFDVVGFDFAPGALELAESLYGDLFTLVHADIFDLPSSWSGQFDYVLEHTCFCAIDPSQRDAYIRTVCDLLKPSGTLVGLFWHHGETDGPPFDTPPEELIERLSPHFSLPLPLKITEGSHPKRENQEFLVIAKRST
ncbi:MAG: methyltransferase domain-containing protein [Cyanobacteria bacterium]|nr:methyltransferase domain-containing protein [Cyanobacteriota bacterium]